ncbi:hypothetical protein MUK42_28591 [Musa troglodytarum]|uniref:Uncharacterized protein n=1 Tax=Musa troglodytarum TaxID=320322 RepID=A0A9E7GB85_9LILI|nr:hypothetical protein MUK42_28591 [Musa troglodytarum]
MSSSRQLNRASTAATMAAEFDLERAEQANLASRAASPISGAALTQPLLLASIQSERAGSESRKGSFQGDVVRREDALFCAR